MSLSMNGNDQPKPYIPSPEEQVKLLRDAQHAVDEWRQVVLANNDPDEARRLLRLSCELSDWRAPLLAMDDTPAKSPPAESPSVEQLPACAPAAQPDLQTLLVEALKGHQISVFGVEFEKDDPDERKPAWKATARVHHYEHFWAVATGDTRGGALLSLLRMTEGASLTRTEHAAIDNLKRVYGL